MNKTFKVSIFLLFSTLIISFTQHFLLRPLIYKKLVEFNESNELINVEIDDIKFTIPFYITTSSIFIQNKKADKYFAIISNLKLLISPLSLIFFKPNILFLKVNDIDVIENFKFYNTTNNISENFYDLTINKLIINKISGIHNITNFDISDVSINGSLHIDKKHIKIYSKTSLNSSNIKDMMSIINLKYNISGKYKIKVFLNKLSQNDLLKFEQLKQINNYFYDIKDVSIFASGSSNDLKSINLEASAKCAINTPIIKDFGESGILLASLGVSFPSINVNELSFQNSKSIHKMNGNILYGLNVNLTISSLIYGDILVPHADIKLPTNISMDTYITGWEESQSIISNLKSNSLFINNNKIEIISPSIKVIVKNINNKFNFKVSLDGNYSGIPFYGDASITSDKKFKEFNINSLEISRGSSQLTANIVALFENQYPLLDGDIYVSSSNLSEWSTLANNDLWGSFDVSIKLDSNSGIQRLISKYTMQGVKYERFSIEDIYGDFYLEFDKYFKYELKASGKYALINNTQIRDIIVIMARNEQNNDELSLYTSGFFGRSFHLYFDSNITHFNSNKIIEISTLSGIFGDSKIGSNNSILIKLDKNSIDIKSCVITIGKGFIELFGSINENSSNFIFKGEDIYYSILRLDLDNRYSGFLNFEGCIENGLLNPKIVADIKTNFRNADDIYSNEISLESHTIIDSNSVDSKTTMFSEKDKIGEFNIYTPIKYIFEERFISLDQKHKQEIFFWFDGNIKDCLSPIFGINMDGFVNVKVKLITDHNLITTSGYLEIINGSFNVQRNGLSVNNINANIKFMNSEIEIEYIEMNDTLDGKISGKGNLSLDKDNLYKYIIYLIIDKFNFVNSEFLTFSLQGHAIYEGDLNEGKITGNLDVVNMRASMDDPMLYIKPKVFESDFIHDFSADDYKYYDKYVNILTNKLPKIYLDLNLNIDPETPAIFLGSGINSYWTGGMHVSGQIYHPKLTGSLNMARGKFEFIHRVFDLNNGTISWEGSAFDEYHMIAHGAMLVNEYEIFVNLGIFNNVWEMHVHSVPYLSRHDIASLIMLNDKASDIKYGNRSKLASTIWNVYIGSYKGKVADMIKESIHIETNEYLIDFNNKEQDNLIVKIGTNPTRKIFAGVGYDTTFNPNKITGFIDVLVNNNILINFVAGKDLLSVGSELKLSF